MLAWPDETCESLANHGFYVIRFDNRDVGLSTKTEEAGIPDLTLNTFVNGGLQHFSYSSYTAVFDKDITLFQIL
ncbi:MAG: hypothetical protein ACFFBD_07650 [Candidatus Hodarchaeota archaeon]